MEWKVMPQFLALTCIIIIHLYARDKSIKQTLKAKFFNLLVYSTAFSIVIYLICYFTRSHYTILPESFLQITNLLDYVGRTFVAVVMTCYLMTVILEDQSRLKRLILLALTPFILFALLALTNPVTRWFFQFQAPEGFQTGKFFNLAYAVGLFYIILMISVTWTNRKKVNRSLRWVFYVFPVVSIMAVVIGLFFPDIILHGVPSTIVILIVYLYLQNKKMVLDDLTGLQNRKAFRLQLIQHIRQQHDIGIVLVSIDNFKGFNQQYGQDKGDNILKEISRFLTELVPKYNVYRYAGDEFAIFLETGDQLTLPTAVNLKFQHPWVMNQIHYPVKASIAMARISYPTDANQVIELLEYCIDQSKQNGGEKVTLANEEVSRQLTRKNQIVRCLKQALAEQGFAVYLQPIYSLKSGKFVSAEALLRLHDKDLGQIPPFEFIPLAEKNNLIIEIGYQVLDLVCQHLRKLEESQVEIDFISVNFSALQMQDPAIVDRVMAIISQNQVDTKKIRIEITESAFIENYDDVMNVIGQLRKNGVKFCLDDFGTGYSNLETVLKLDLEYIKIDKSILYNSVTSEKYFELMKGLVRIFTELGIKVIIEGVENQIHNDIVNRIDAHLIQGYLYARPVPAAETSAYFGKGAEVAEAKR